MRGGFKDNVLAASKDDLNNPATASASQAAAHAARFYAFVFLLPINGSTYSWNDASWIPVFFIRSLLSVHGFPRFPLISSWILFDFPFLL